MLHVNLNAHHEDLDKIIAKHTAAGNQNLGAGIYLRIRSVRGQRNADSSWKIEYHLEEVNPFEQD